MSEKPVPVMWADKNFSQAISDSFKEGCKQSGNGFCPCVVRKYSRPLFSELTVKKLEEELEEWKDFGARHHKLALDYYERALDAERKLKEAGK